MRQSGDTLTVCTMDSKMSWSFGPFWLDSKTVVVVDIATSRTGFNPGKRGKAKTESVSPLWHKKGVKKSLSRLYNCAYIARVCRQLRFNYTVYKTTIATVFKLILE